MTQDDDQATPQKVTNRFRIQWTTTLYLDTLDEALVVARALHASARDMHKWGIQVAQWAEDDPDFHDGGEYLGVVESDGTFDEEPR